MRDMQESQAETEVDYGISKTTHCPFPSLLPLPPEVYTLTVRAYTGSYDRLYPPTKVLSCLPA